MSLTETVVEGTLRPDGTLELDQRPNLSPGRVKVILQPAQGAPRREKGLADVIDEIRQNRQARGEQDRSAEEIDATLREGEEEYEKKMQSLRSETTTPPSTLG